MTGAVALDAGMAFAGKGLRAYGALMEGKSQAASLKKQAEAKIRQAAAVRESGIWEGIRFNEDVRRTLSTQRMLFGQAGVTLEGAPEGFMRGTNREFVLERMQRASNVASEIATLNLEAREFERAAKRAKRGGVIGAFSAFLG